MFCPKCGSENGNDVSYCNSCSYSFEKRLKKEEGQKVELSIKSNGLISSVKVVFNTYIVFYFLSVFTILGASLWIDLYKKLPIVIMIYSSIILIFNVGFLYVLKKKLSNNNPLIYISEISMNGMKLLILLSIFIPANIVCAFILIISLMFLLSFKKNITKISDGFNISIIISIFLLGVSLIYIIGSILIPDLNLYSSSNYEHVFFVIISVFFLSKIIFFRSLLMFLNKNTGLNFKGF